MKFFSRGNNRKLSLSVKKCDVLYNYSTDTKNFWIDGTIEWSWVPNTGVGTPIYGSTIIYIKFIKINN